MTRTILTSVTKTIRAWKPIVRALPLIALLAAVTMLSACGSLSLPNVTVTSTTTPQQALAQLGTFTQADLTAAIAEAKAANDTEATTCFTFISTNLTTLQGQVGSVTAPAGVFSAFEEANIGLNNIGTGLSPVSKTSLEIACGPLLQHIVAQAMTVQQEVVNLGSAIAIVAPK